MSRCVSARKISLFCALALYLAASTSASALPLAAIASAWNRAALAFAFWMSSSARAIASSFSFWITARSCSLRCSIVSRSATCFATSTSRCISIVRSSFWRWASCTARVRSISFLSCSVFACALDVSCSCTVLMRSATRRFLSISSRSKLGSGRGSPISTWVTSMPYWESGFSARCGTPLSWRMGTVFHTSCLARTSLGPGPSGEAKPTGARSVCSISTCRRSVR
mmetsp:Transcript_17021/g.49333  ORF Transcript_17021/g.49333 Transcript_17021/m.49333 type:complete len:225 (-) Transcript_17021:267-941(-)